MGLRTVLTGAAALLRTHPTLFLPRLALTAATSLIWIKAVHAIGVPLRTTALPELVGAAALMLLVFPVQVWVYNAYVVAVKQLEDTDTFDMPDAFRAGLRRLPHGIAAMLLPMAAVAVATMPGAVLLTAGIASRTLLLQAAGAVFILFAVLLVAVRCYFVPVAAVLGTESFTANVRSGLVAARKRQRAVTALTALSFTVLAATFVLEGVLEQVGLAGFLIGRILTTMISVYLIVVNPELYLSPLQSASTEA